jgi:predicted anti-sigma-YlaC factor YlaD
MRCDDVREVLSARLDGEAPPPGLDTAAADAHVATCPGCSGFAQAATRHHRAMRIRSAEPVPDLTEAILARTAPLHPQPIREWARYGLFVVAATQLLLAIPAMLGGDGAAGIHATRELAGTDVAVAVGFLWAAWQPRRAAGLLPLALALAGMMLATAVLDVADGDARAVAESVHVLDLAGVGLLWALARPPRQRDEHAPTRALAA